ncbi:MAG: hypothetical protein JXA66_05370 [Oligoflexia bacterium]|nr:hypothetical protein [Oligoflexia bacterium]
MEKRLDQTIAGLESMTSVIEEVREHGENNSGIAVAGSSIEPEYTLLINGIAHSEDQQKLVSELADPVLGVDIADVEKQAAKGYVAIRHIREMTGAVIASRLKDLDCSFYLDTSEQIDELFPQLKSVVPRESAVTDEVILCTGDHISGKRVFEYLDLIWVEQFVSSDREQSQGFSDWIQGELSEKMKDRARELGANAVLGIQLKISGKNPDPVYILFGTAVKVF